MISNAIIAKPGQTMGNGTAKAGRSIIAAATTKNTMSPVPSPRPKAVVTGAESRSPVIDARPFRSKAIGMVAVTAAVNAGPTISGAPIAVIAALGGSPL
jgi:hypothetical protein